MKIGYIRNDNVRSTPPMTLYTAPNRSFAGSPNFILRNSTIPKILKSEDKSANPISPNQHAKIIIMTYIEPERARIEVDFISTIEKI